MRLFQHYGRYYKVLAFQTIEETNKFLTQNPKWGVLSESKEEIFVTRMDELGYTIEDLPLDDLKDLIDPSINKGPIPLSAVLEAQKRGIKKMSNKTITS